MCYINIDKYVCVSVISLNIPTLKYAVVSVI